METKDLIKAISSDAAPVRRPLGTLLLAAFDVASVIGVVFFPSSPARVLISLPPPKPGASCLNWSSPWRWSAQRALWHSALLGPARGSACASACSPWRPPSCSAHPHRTHHHSVGRMDDEACRHQCLRLPDADPAHGLGPLAVLLNAMRQGAPTRPTLAGAACGLLAGGLAATLYAAHCFDDSPFFVATWYTLAIAILTVVGAIAGRYMLRW